MEIGCTDWSCVLVAVLGFLGGRLFAESAESGFALFLFDFVDVDFSVVVLGAVDREDVGEGHVTGVVTSFCVLGVLSVSRCGKKRSSHTLDFVPHV